MGGLPKVSVVVENISIEMLVDSGASVIIVDKHSYYRICDMQNRTFTIMDPEHP